MDYLVRADTWSVDSQVCADQTSALTVHKNFDFISDIPSNDVAALISTINPIDLDKIYKSQVQECKAAQIKYKNEALKDRLQFYTFAF